jgi:hypothetical protein
MWVLDASYGTSRFSTELAKNSSGVLIRPILPQNRSNRSVQMVQNGSDNTGSTNHPPQSVIFTII